ncbi:NifU family protein [Candidatus Babeliales bacterium]|nr:NifU family protein [Candidatus Babeliales bacterium]
MDNKEIINQIEQALDQVRHYLLMHGGNINFIKYEDEKVFVKLQGACHGCPASSQTLKFLIEESLKREVPQVKEIIEVGF